MNDVCDEFVITKVHSPVKWKNKTGSKIYTAAFN